MNVDILQRLAIEIQDFYENPSSVTPTVTAEQVREYLEHYDFQAPVPQNELFGEVMQMMRYWNIQISHPRYFGLFNPAPTLSAIVAEAMVATYNPQMAAWSHAPAANEIERHTLHYIARKIGLLPEHHSNPSGILAANFTAGGSEANHSAVLVAMAHHFPETLENGLLFLKKQPVLYVSELAHNSFDKIAKHVGLGLNALRIVPVTDDLKMDTAALQSMLTQDKADGFAPFMVVGTAGLTSCGVIDPLSDLAAFCQKHQLWFHVDGAWGGAAVFSPVLKPYLAGIELADSVTIDAHKWFNLTMGAGMFLTRHPQANAAAFNVRADYMPASQEDVAVPYLTTMQWSRRFIGLKLFMMLADMGEENFAQLMVHQTAMGERFRQKISEAGWQVVNDTPLPVVNFTHPALMEKGLTVDGVLAQLYAEHEVWISSVTLRGQKVFRMCITNFKTTEADVDFLVERLKSLLHTP
ncbi:MAG: pyridoxal-dependent decarboxylase [Spirosomaceae bacterium]|jgi:glutamate/tyrosine decarboxylase-like PLP-dependent enzyme|nr:pyridoxal-dependent decarboxylase [Spirosomataceae bacterium]